MDCLSFYSQLRTTLSSGSHDDLWKFLLSARDENGVHYLHDYLCEELPKVQAVCSRCESLLMLPLLQEGNTGSNTHNLRGLLLQHGACPLRQDKTYCHTDTDKLRLLLKFGAYPPKEICAAGYPYNRTRSTPLKRAVQSGSIHDVERLLTSQEADDVNWHPEFCVGCDHLFLQPCADCDTPLMAAVRRKDIAMMRLLIAHGANVSEEVYGVYVNYDELTSKTALLVALFTENQEVITELVTSGADVNQRLGPYGTCLHMSCHDLIPNPLNLVELGADPNLTDDFGKTPVSLLLKRWPVRPRGDTSTSYPESLRSLLPATRDLVTIVQTERLVGHGSAHINNKIMRLFLQHGARIRYSQMYLTGSAEWASKVWRHSDQHSERFIELLRAADTDFSGVRQRIASVDKDEWAPLNLTVLDQKLSQTLTLQAWCVISVRRQLCSVGDCGLWNKIDELPLPPIIKDHLKLDVW